MSDILCKPMKAPLPFPFPLMFRKSRDFQGDEGQQARDYL